MTAINTNAVVADDWTNNTRFQQLVDIRRAPQFATSQQALELQSTAFPAPSTTSKLNVKLPKRVSCLLSLPYGILLFDWGILQESNTTGALFVCLFV